MLIAAGLVSACAVQAGDPGASALPGVGAIDSDTLPEEATPAGLVAAPELFSVSGVAVWDGKRTVPGIWVAHPRASASMDARIIHGATGAEVDGRVYRSADRATGDVITLSSDAAEALGLEPGRRARLSIVALTPDMGLARQKRMNAERTARSALAGYAATLDHDRLAQLVGALMRGMGYETRFEDGLLAEGGTGIMAVPAGAGPMPAVRVAVRAGEAAPVTGADMGAFGDAIGGRGAVGLVVSVPGFAREVRQGGLAGGAFIEMLDLDGLLALWVDRYAEMAEVDRALLPLQPVYFLAAN